MAGHSSCEAGQGAELMPLKVPACTPCLALPHPHHATVPSPALDPERELGLCICPAGATDGYGLRE